LTTSYKRDILTETRPTSGTYIIIVALGGLVVIVLATGPRFAGLNPAEDDWFLSAIKIRGTISFGGVT
jgi:hypothetical protein